MVKRDLSNNIRLHRPGAVVGRWILVAINLLIVLIGQEIIAQDVEMFPPDEIKKVLQAVEAKEPIKIDGILNEAIWQSVKPSPRFIQIDPHQGSPPTHDTEIKVIYDDKHLYFGVVCLDSLGKKAIRATDFKRDFNFQTHDLITICIDGFNDERNAMSFAVNPYGVQRDYLSFDALYYDIDWDGYWTTRTSRTDSGWVAEIAIPWKTLRYPKSESKIQDWGFQLYRNRRMTYEISAFSQFPRSFGAARMDYAGRLQNLKPPPPKPNVRINPYMLSSFDQSNVDSGTERLKEEKIKVGGDVKWAINSNDVLDLTINTDFAQADVDRQINNTSRFSVFFPERRQFFLENASLFGINIGPSGVAGGRMRIQPFFSRSIGLDNNGAPLPLDVGARYVHRSTKSNYGAMLIRQGRGNETPGTNFFVGRYSNNFGKQNRIGGLITVKNQPNESNVTGTVDALFRIGASHTLNTMISYSNASGNNLDGLSAITQYYYSNNKWKAWWTQSFVSKNYNPEMGFISRSDVIGTTPGIIGFFRGEKLPFKKWLRAFEPSVLFEFYHQASTGQLIERKLTSYPVYLNLQSGGFLGYGINSFFQNLNTAFIPLGVEIGIGEYDYLQHEVFGSTDKSKQLAISGNYKWGTFFNGDFNSVNLNLTFVPIPHVSINSNFNRIKFDGVGILEQNKVVDILSFEGRFAINPRLQLSAIYQRNTESNLDNLNLRFSWEYKPLSYLYIVYNHRGFEDELSVTRKADQVIGKFSFMRQF